MVRESPKESKKSSGKGISLSKAALGVALLFLAVILGMSAIIGIMLTDIEQVNAKGGVLGLVPLPRNLQFNW